MRTVIADGQKLFREGLAELLRRHEACELLGVAADGRETLSLVGKLKPDLVLLGIRMPGMDGTTCCRTIRRRYPDTRIMALSRRNDWRHVQAMLEAGADGFALKDSGFDNLIGGMQSVCRGECFLDPGLASLPIRNGNEAGGESRLSSRERQIAQLLVEGHTNTSIATNLQISIKTVETHRGRIFTKLQVGNIVELVRLAIRNDWIDP